uniref:hypothetical protein n=1 Tax=Paenibacillus xylanexedens TaxID=528191 RepID=UPI001C92CA41
WAIEECIRVLRMSVRVNIGWWFICIGEEGICDRIEGVALKWVNGCGVGDECCGGGREDKKE